MFTTFLLKKEHLVSDIWRFHFVVPDYFTWQAGQHVVLIIDHPHADEKGHSRALSIVTAPFERKISFITHCPIEGASSFKKALHGLEKGSEVVITQAQGNFTSKNTKPGQVFLVGGVGIGSVRAILMQQDFDGESLQAQVYYYAPADQHLFKDDFKLLNDSHPQFHIQYLVQENLHELGVIKIIEQHLDGEYFFSGVYTRQMLAKEEIITHLEQVNIEERKEIEMLARSSGLL